MNCDNPYLEERDPLMELITLIDDFQGEFCLIFAVCNFYGLQKQILKQLKEESEQSSLNIDLSKISPQAKSIYTFIRKKNSRKKLNSIVIHGLEEVKEIDDLLSSANQSRELLAKSFSFPIVVFINQEISDKLQRIYVDLRSWGRFVTFECSLTEIKDFLTKTNDRIFESIIKHRENSFLDQELFEGEEKPRYSEIKIAQEKIEESEPKSPALEEIEFILGYCSHNEPFLKRKQINNNSYLDNLAIAEDHYKISLENYKKRKNHEKSGLVSHYIGLICLSQSLRNYSQRKIKAEEALIKFKESINYFNQDKSQNSNSPLYKAKFINFLLGSYYLLGINTKKAQYWKKLENIAKQALDIHKNSSYCDPFREAFAQEVLAEIECYRQNWKISEHYAQQAYNIFTVARENSPESLRFLQIQDKFNQPWYLFTLAKAIWKQIDRENKTREKIDKETRQKIQNAKKYLQEAEKKGKVSYAPWLHMEIQRTLQEICYFQQSYKEAFKHKLKKNKFEFEYGFRAFIGAKKLYSRKQQTSPALSPLQFSENVSQTIDFSIRQKDLDNIYHRIENKQKLTVIYGPSGTGKSSLIEAGLIPQLELGVNRDGYKYHPILINSYRKSPKYAEDLANYQRKIQQFRKERKIIVLIFDQFEIFFHRNYSLQERIALYEFIADCLDISKTSTQIILSIREDYYHYLLDLEDFLKQQEQLLFESTAGNKRLKEYASLRNQNNQLILDNLKEEDVKQLIKRLTDSVNLEWENELINTITKDLQKNYITIHDDILLIELQVICYQLEEENIKTLAEYQNYPAKYQEQQKCSKQLLIENYIEGIIKDCSSNPETQTIARSILYFLTSSYNRRLLKTSEQLLDELNLYFIKNQKKLKLKIDWILEIFEKSNLVSIIKDLDERYQYQISHDYFVTFIRDFSANKIRKELKQAQEKLKDTNDELESQNTELETKNRKLNRLTKTLIGLSVFLFLITGIAWGLRNQAKKAERENKITQLNTEYQFLSGQGKQLEALIHSLESARVMKQGNVDNVIKEATLRNLNNSINFSQEIYDSHSDLIDTDEEHKNSILKIYIPHGESQDLVNIDTFDSSGQKISWLWSKKEKQWLKVNLSGDNKDSDPVLNFLGQYKYKIENIGNFVISNDKSLIILGLTDGKLIIGKKKQPDEKYEKVFPPDNQKQKTNDDNNEIEKNCELASKKTRERYSQKQKLWGVAIYEDETKRLIASGGDDCKITIWKLDSETNNLEFIDKLDHTIDAKEYTINNKKFYSHKDRINNLAFHSEKLILASASDDGTVKLWLYQENINKITPVINLEAHYAPVNDVTFSKFEPELMASADSNGKIILWRFHYEDNNDDPNKVKVEWRKTINTADPSINRIQFLPIKGSKELLIAGHIDGRITVWDLNKIIPKIYLPAEFIHGYNSSIYSGKDRNNQDTNLLAFRQNINRNRIRIWDIDKNKSLKDIPDKDIAETKKGIAVYDVVFNPQNKDEMAITYGDGSIVLKNITIKDNFQKLYSSSDDLIWSLAFSEDGNKIIAGYSSGKIILWERNNNGEFEYQKSQQSLSRTDIFKVSFSPNGNWIASAGKDGKVIIYDSQLNPQNIKTNYNNSNNNNNDSGAGAIYSLAFTDDSLVAGSETGKILTWELEKNKKEWKRNPDVENNFYQIDSRHWDKVYSLAYSHHKDPNEKILASASKDKTIKIWNLKGNLLATLHRGDSEKVFVGWTKDNKLLAINKDIIININNQNGQKNKDEEKINTNISVEELLDYSNVQKFLSDGDSEQKLNKFKGEVSIKGVGLIRVWENIDGNLNNKDEKLIQNGCQKANTLLKDPRSNIVDSNTESKFKNDIEKIMKFCQKRLKEDSL